MTVLNRLHKMAVEMIVPGYGQVAAREATYLLPEEVWQTRAVVRRVTVRAAPSQTRPGWSCHSSWTRLPATGDRSPIKADQGQL
jgi:hypothetical protein